jgi:hypothetical protein
MTYHDTRGGIVINAKTRLVYASRGIGFCLGKQ